MCGLSLLIFDMCVRSQTLKTLLGSKFFITESLILAQNERWRRGLGMQVER